MQTDYEETKELFQIKWYRDLKSFHKNKKQTYVDFQKVI